MKCAPFPPRRGGGGTAGPEGSAAAAAAGGAVRGREGPWRPGPLPALGLRDPQPRDVQQPAASHSRKESEGQQPALPPPRGRPGLPGPLCLLPPLLPTWRGGQGRSRGRAGRALLSGKEHGGFCIFCRFWHWLRHTALFRRGTSKREKKRRRSGKLRPRRAVGSGAPAAPVPRGAAGRAGAGGAHLPCPHSPAGRRQRPESQRGARCRRQKRYSSLLPGDGDSCPRPPGGGWAVLS